MTFTGNENHSITLEEASKLTANYRKSAGSGARLAGFFGKTTIEKLLEQEGCVGLRVYYAQDDEGTPEMVLVGAKADEDDIIGIIAERVVPCPPNCGTANPLNSDL